MRLLIAAVLLVPATTFAQGAIQKCVAADGKVNYQDTPCDAQQKAAGTIKRDTTKMDQAAYIRSEQDRIRLKLMQLEREREWVAEQIRREKFEKAEAAARERAEAEARADARNQAIVDALKQPYGSPYISGPSYSPPRIVERQAPPAPAPRAPTYSGPAAAAPKK